MRKTTSMDSTGRETTVYGLPLPAKAEIFFSVPRLYKFFCSVTILSIQQNMGPFRRVKLPVHFHPLAK